MNTSYNIFVVGVRHIKLLKRSPKLRTQKLINWSKSHWPFFQFTTKLIENNLKMVDFQNYNLVRIVGSAEILIGFEMF